MRKIGTLSLIAALLVASMVFTSVTYMPEGSAASGSSGTQITIEVRDSTTMTHIIGATAELQDVHHSVNSLSGVSDMDGNATVIATAGTYRLSVNATGYFDVTRSELVTFEGTADIHAMVYMDQIGPSHRCIFNVTNGTSGIPTSSIVLDVAHNGTSTSYAGAAVGGNISMDLPPGDYRMTARAPGYISNITEVTIPNDSVYMTVNLTEGVNYTIEVSLGYVPSAGLRGYLVPKDGTITEIRNGIVQARVHSTSLSFDAAIGNYTLLVTADGATASISDVDTSGTPSTVVLNGRYHERYDTNITYGPAGWNLLSMTESVAASFDRTIPGIDYSWIPSIRMQADLAYGDGDGSVTTSEVSAFATAIASLGPYRLTTDELILLRVSGQVPYDSVQGNTSLTFTDLVGLANSTVSVTTHYRDDYRISGTPVLGDGNSYPVRMLLQYNTVAASRSYHIAPPSGFESTPSTIHKDPNRLLVIGDINVTILSVTRQAGETITPSVDLTFQKSVAPMAKGAVTAPSANFKLVTVNQSYGYYIVANNTDITFSAAGSTDNNSNPLRYSWDFGDGTTTEATGNLTSKHRFTSAAYYRNVTLTVTDSTNRSSSCQINVKVDDQDPIPVISQNGVPVTTIYCQQRDSMVFSHELSLDWIAGSSDPAPEVLSSFIWDFGDGTKKETPPSLTTNVSHLFSKAGTFQITLKVTDRVGHFSTVSATAIINDTDAPVAKIVIQRSGSNITNLTAPERAELTFNGSDSSDNSGPIASYTWYFGDGSSSEGAIVNHTYAVAGTYTVKLNLKDPSGNQANLSKTLNITVGPRPDLRILSISVEPSNIVEGQTVMVKLIILNVGTANATNVLGQFYVIDGSGARVFIGNSSLLYVNGSAVDRLGVGETGYIALSSSFSSIGAFNLEANVSASDEIVTVDNGVMQAFSASASGMKLLDVLAIMAAIIIVAIVVLLLVFRKRIFRRKKK